MSPSGVDQKLGTYVEPLLRRAILCLAMAAVCIPALARAQSAQDLRVGNWVEVKGTWDGDDLFTAQSVEALPPGEEDVLLGDASDVASDGTSFTLLGQLIQVSEKTNWRKVRFGDLAGTRVKVEGYYRGPRKFSSRSIALRPEGRDRLQGRIDELRRVDAGYELRIMRYLVRVPETLAVETETALSDLALAPLVQHGSDLSDSNVRQRDEDDYIPGTLRLRDDLSLGLRLEYKLTDEENFDLDSGDTEDRLDNRFTLRGELVWRPTDDFYGLAGFRQSMRFRDDQEDGSDREGTTRLSEAFGYWRDVGMEGLDLQVGRQDFDEKREWLYDQNLDAVRLIYTRPELRVELSASTTLSDGSPRDEETTNLIGYVSNNDQDRELAAYVIDRRDDRSVEDYPIHFGVRAIGDWIPANESWAELSMLRGYTDDVDLESYGFDIGTTWSPRFASPLYFNFGYAFGSGDDDPFDGKDEAFRQTGLQDNNDKLGGVTSFRYYGELVDPELSNMGILTLGVGTRIGRRNSLDLVYHRFVQDEPTDFLRDTDLDRKPDGIHDDLGWELDLVFGSRALEKWDFEIVGGMFEPGDAFPGGDTAYLVKIQARFKF